jgi:hypothetical protein
MCQKELNPECLQVVKKGGHIKVLDISEQPPDLIYDGGPNIDCLLDAIAIHFGFEGTEVHELEGEAVDPLDIFKKESLDNRVDKDEEEGEEDGEPGEPIEIDPDGLEFDEDTTDIPEEDHGIPDWDDDWEED